VLDVLETLAASRSPLSMPELVRRLAIPRSTLLAIVAELEQAGWIARHDDGFLLGAPAKTVMGARPIARLAEVLADAVAELGYPINYFRVSGDELVVAGVHPQQPGAWHVTAGQRLPLLFPSGAASMPWRTADEIAAWARGASDPDAVARALHVARLHGCVFFAPDPSERSFDDVLRQLLGTIREDELPDETKERLHAQLIRLTSVPCDAAEVEGEAPFAVSYVAAPVRHAGGSIHELHLVVLGEVLPRARRDELRAALARWTATIGRSLP
jgi:DNA-binding IclR family transcriptional regulator